MSSSGHLSTESNKNLVYKSKPNNMGLFLGKVEKYNSNKGYVTIKLQEKKLLLETPLLLKMKLVHIIFLS